MKAILEFQIPDEEQEFKEAVNVRTLLQSYNLEI